MRNTSMRIKIWGVVVGFGLAVVTVVPALAAGGVVWGS
jgi:hypothetical protein